MIKIRFKRRTNLENSSWLFLEILILFWLAIIIIKEIQKVKEIRIVDIESWFIIELSLSILQNGL